MLLLTFSPRDTFNLQVYFCSPASLLPFSFCLFLPPVLLYFIVIHIVYLIHPVLFVFSATGPWTWLGPCFWAEFQTSPITSRLAPESLSAALKSFTLTTSRWTSLDLLLTTARLQVSFSCHHICLCNIAYSCVVNIKLLSHNTSEPSGLYNHWEIIKHAIRLKIFRFFQAAAPNSLSANPTLVKTEAPAGWAGKRSSVTAP